MLSQKPISKWLSDEMGHVGNLSYQQVVCLLSVWVQAERFIPEIRTGHQADFLFLYAGGSEIFYAFLSGTEEPEWEKVRRLCAAEIAGRFLEVKYYKNDLEREIALRLPNEIQQFWMKNTQAQKGWRQSWF